MKIKRWLLLVVISLCFEAAKAEDRPLKVVTPESFLAANPSAERKDIVDFIIKQVHEKPVVTQAQLDEVWAIQPNSHRLRLQIIDQKLYGEALGLENKIMRHRCAKFITYIQSLLRNYKIKDVDFIVHLGDGLAIDFSAVPSFIMSKDNNSEHEKALLLLPDGYMLDKGWHKTIEQISAARMKYLWKHKEDKIFWRGATTGGAYNIENFDKLPRLSLVILSSLYPDMISAKFSQYDQLEASESGRNLKNLLGLLAPEGLKSVKEAEHLQYKYLISLDGNTCAWKRVPWIMFSNSVLVKQETSKTQWFYPAMKPYVHYVPVNERLTDLFLQFEWLKTHDAEAQQISNNAHNFVENNLMPEHIEAHMVLIFNEYHKLHNGEVLRPNLLKANDLLTYIDTFEYKDLTAWNRVKYFFKSLRHKLKNSFIELFAK